MAAEAVAKAKVEVAARGLNATVIQNYYAILSAQHHAANTQISIAEAQRFLDITQKQEQAGRGSARGRDQGADGVCRSCSAICRMRRSRWRKPRSRWAC